MSDGYNKPRPTDPEYEAAGMSDDEYFAALGRLARGSSLGRLAMLDMLRGAFIVGALLGGVCVLVICWWLA